MSVGIGNWGGLNPFGWHASGPLGLLFAGLNILFLSIFFALVAMAITALFPERTKIVAETAVERTGASILYGILAILLTVPIAVMLVLTCVGVPLIVVEIILLAGAWFFGKMGIGLALGSKIADSAHHPDLSPIVSVGIGLVVIGLIHAIPIVGGIVAWILSLIGFGAVIASGFGTDHDWWKNRRRGSSPQIPPPPYDEAETIRG